MDTDGYIIIADRITDVIRSGAEMVPTVLLENLTANADFVLEATYVGVPDEKWGERPMAMIKLVPGAQATAEGCLEIFRRGRRRQRQDNPLDAARLCRLL